MAGVLVGVNGILKRRSIVARSRVVASVLAVAAMVMLAVNSAPGQAQADSCLSAGAILDADVVRHADQLSNPTLCLMTRTVSVNDVAWRLTIVRNADRPGPLWAVPHDEEDVAFATGVYAVREYGGVMIAIENDERRMVGDLDPNHIFTTTQSEAALCNIGQPPQGFIEVFLGDWKRDQPVIGLHTNWDGFIEGGGRGTISVERQDDKMIPFPSFRAMGRFADEDTVAMLVSTLPPAENESGRADIDWFNGHGIHVIYRHVTDENNGCTLADYLTLNHLGEYINLEVEHGDAETHAALVDHLIRFLNSPAHRELER